MHVPFLILDMVFRRSGSCIIVFQNSSTLLKEMDQAPIAKGLNILTPLQAGRLRMIINCIFTDNKVAAPTCIICIRGFS